MKIEYFLDENNEKYQIQVIAPTHTYGTMHSFDSQFDFEIDFDEYDKEAEWEFNVVVDGEIIVTVTSIQDAKDYIENSLIK